MDECFGAWNSDVFYFPADGLLARQHPLGDHTFRLHRHLFQRCPHPIAEHIVAVTPSASAGDWTLRLYCPAGFTRRIPWISLHSRRDAQAAYRSAMQLLKYAFTLLSYSTAYITHSPLLWEEEAERGELSPCFPSDGVDMTCAAGQIIKDK